MADYEKVSVRAVASAASDYSDPKNDTGNQEVTSAPEYVPRCGDCIASVGGLTVMAASEFPTAVDTFFIKNNDASGAVLITYKDALGTTLLVSVAAGNMFLTQDVIRTNSITVASGGGNIECYVYLSGN